MSKSDVPNEDRKTRIRDALGLILAVAALITLLVIVIVALEFLPSDRRGENVVALATSAFGVIGTIVGAYFGIRSSHAAAEQLKR